MEYKSAQKQLIKIFQIWNRTSSYKKVIYQPKITFKQGHYIKIPYFHEFSKKKNDRYCNKNFLKRLHISYNNCINFLNIHFHICSLNTNTYTLTTKINVKVICTCESSLNNSNVHVYTHKLHTCIHQSHKTSLDIFSSFILIAYAHNNDKKKSHWKISEWNISEVTIFPSKFHVSFRLQLFPPWMFLKERGKDSDFAANFFSV